jgi:RHS repeat-associated protein
LYDYDEIHRLRRFDRGELNSSQTEMANRTFAQFWALDECGNWDCFKVDDTGSGTWSLVQSRTANLVNEISGLDERTGPSWAAPAYSATGNMTIMPDVQTPTSSDAASYDAWRRLTKLVADTTTSEYVYDGAGRQIVQISRPAVGESETKQFYYTEPSRWRMLEERRGASNDASGPNRQFVWGRRYVDDCVLRDRDASDSGVLDERLFSLQDANWNVTGLINTSGDVLQRMVYLPYGISTVLDSAWTEQADTYAWELYYAAYRYEPSTRLYHVRNRGYHALLGRWLQRDPIEYEGGANLYEYLLSKPLTLVDPLGMQVEDPALMSWISQCNRIDMALATSGEIGLSFDASWAIFAFENPHKASCSGLDPFGGNTLRERYWAQGCVGATACQIGLPPSVNRDTGWFKNCYSTLAFAKAAQKRDVDSKACPCPRKPVIFGFRWTSSDADKENRKSCPGCGYIYWNGTRPERSSPPPHVGTGFDFGFYDECRNAFWDASTSENNLANGQTSNIRICRPNNFHPPQGKHKDVVYCVLCDGPNADRFDKISNLPN